MLRIISVEDERLVKKKITEGAKLISIDGFKVSDQFDVNFHSDEDELLLEFFDKNGTKRRVKISQELIDKIAFEPLKPKKCGAHCIFCFVEQLPKGLRKTLYHKDEDYRFSYIYGNYVAMANVKKSDLQRIVLYRLSPLYISVHSTDPVLRGKILGLKKSAPILPYIRFLALNRITLHCQVVLCPGINDGKYLEKTIKDLSKYYPNVSSLAVVPVGLTSHREGKFPLTSFDSKKAAELINQLKPLQKRFLDEYGTHFVFLSDEFYLLAKKAIPQADFYGDFSQLENGVGITRQFIDDAECLLKQHLAQKKSDKKIAVVTGTLAYKTVLSYIDKLSKKTGLSVTLFPIENRLLGNTVTVTGLICGRDIIENLKDKKFDALFVPDVMLRDKKDTFLDDLTTGSLKKYFQCSVYQFTPLLSELYKKLMKTGFLDYKKTPSKQKIGG